jgi:AcrR family transcriptional regulator
MMKKESGTRERILEAAMALIGEQGGAEGLTMRDIAARAGVGLGLANYHYQTKENLVSLCAQRASGAFLGGFGERYMRLDLEPAAKIRQLAKEYLSSLAADPGLSRASLAHGFLTPSPGDGTDGVAEAFLPLVREACAGKATEREARMLCHMLFCSLQAAFLRGGAFKETMGLDVNDEKQRDQLVDLTIYILFYKYM